MVTTLWIALGAALGGVTRFWLSGVVARLAGETFPLGTLVVNITGCFTIGVFAALTGPHGRFGGGEVQAFLLTGVCGGYTTFSSFSLQTLALARNGHGRAAMANAVLSVALCLVAVAAGYAVGG